MEVTKGKVSEKWEGFSKGKCCVNRIFTMKMVRKEYLGKGKKLYVIFLYLQRAHSMVERETEMF